MESKIITTANIAYKSSQHRRCDTNNKSAFRKTIKEYLVATDNGNELKVLFSSMPVSF